MRIAQAGGDPNKAKVFADRAISGTSMNRPAFEDLMALATSKARPFDVILAEDMSRISRDIADADTIYKRH